MHQCIYCSPMSVWNSEATSDSPIYWHHSLNNTTYENTSPALRLDFPELNLALVLLPSESLQPLWKPLKSVFMLHSPPASYLLFPQDSSLHSPCWVYTSLPPHQPQQWPAEGPRMTDTVLCFHWATWSSRNHKPAAVKQNKRPSRCKLGIMLVRQGDREENILLQMKWKNIWGIHLQL